MSKNVIYLFKIIMEEKMSKDLFLDYLTEEKEKLLTIQPRLI